MSPLRLVIIGVLVYLFYRLLAGGRKISAPKPSGTRNGQAPIASDVLVEDPVCHTYIPRKQAIELGSGKETIFFCSQKCKKKFIESESKGESL